MPDISGDRIVWEDYRNSAVDIYIFDLATNTESRITEQPVDQSEPAISGSRIVWTDERNGDSDIYLFDLMTGTETRITSDPARQLRPAISGDRIVWEDYRHGCSDIYMFDLATSVETRITTDPACQDFPDISGNRIVWRDLRNVTFGGSSEIFVYDLATLTEAPIPGTFDQINGPPRISGDRIVWNSRPEQGSGSIALFELGTDTWLRRIPTEAPNAGVGDISGHRIVFVSAQSATEFDIYLYDLTTGAETPITTAPGIQTFPAISGTRIVWEDRRNESDPGGPGRPNSDIYMLELALEPQLVPVDIDIKPGSDNKTIYPKSRRGVPVAILGDSRFDVRDIDRTTLRFGPAGATPTHTKTLGHLEDVNNDEYMDLVSHYRQVSTGLSPGDTEACVTGQMQSGVSFQGCGPVHVNEPGGGHEEGG